MGECLGGSRGVTLGPSVNALHREGPETTRIRDRIEADRAADHEAYKTATPAGYFTDLTYGTVRKTSIISIGFEGFP